MNFSLPLKKSLGIICLMIFYLTTFSQHIHYHFKRKISTNTRYDAFRKRISKYDDQLYLTDFTASNSIWKIYILKNNSKVINDSLLLETPSNYSNDFLSFAVNKDFIIVCGDSEILIYKKKIGNYYSIVHSLQNTESYSDVEFMYDNIFVVYKCYNYHPLTTKEKIKISLFDANDLKFTASLTPNHDGVAFSVLVNSWIDVSSRYIFFSQTLQYKIFVYDRALNLVDSICASKDQWKNFPQFVIPFETDFDKANAKAVSYQLQKSDEHISRIEKIFCIDDSTILISYFHANKKNKRRELDVWRISNNKWTPLTDNEYIRCSNLFITRKKFLLDFYTSAQFAFLKNNLYCLEMDVPLRFSIPRFIYFLKIALYINKSDDLKCAVYNYQFGIR